MTPDRKPVMKYPIRASDDTPKELRFACKEDPELLDSSLVDRPGVSDVVEVQLGDVPNDRAAEIAQTYPRLYGKGIEFLRRTDMGPGPDLKAALRERLMEK